jgi:O-antigen/teichoic acid export membrane protein
MTKIDKIALLKNVGSSWVALGVTVIAGFFLSPYILHHLGDEAFGLWVLIFSITGYYGLFDLGIRSSIVRYVAKYAATDDRQQLNLLVNTALFSYAAIGFVCLLITAVATYFVALMFRVPPEFLRTARLLFAMVGTSVALGFPLGVFGGILDGLQRFMISNVTSLSSTLLRAVLILIALQHGGGLLTVAFITVSLPLVASLVNAGIVLRLLPIRFSLHNLDRRTLRRIASYSGPTFMIIVAARLRFRTDALVIGTFLSATAITYFTVGARLLEYSGEVVNSLAQIFVPMSSQLHATNDLDQLKKIVVAGNRACSFIIFPIATILVLLGKSVIEAWVGPRYVAQSYPVMLVLLVAYCLMLSQSACNRVLFGMAKHKILAIVTLVEGAANLALSIALVRRFGIFGDALGTAIPLSCTMLFFLPHHVCRLLKISLRTYIREAFTLPLVLCVPLVGTLLWMRRWFVPHNYLQLCLQLLLGVAVYGAGLLWAFRTGRAWNVGELSVNNSSTELPIEIVEGD